MRLATNAPASWPAVHAEREVLARGKGAVLELIRTALAKTPYRVTAEGHPFPLKEGVIFADALIVREDERWPLFIYTEATPEAAQHFFTTDTLLALHFPEYFPSVYYAPRPLEHLPRSGPAEGVLEKGFVFRPAKAPLPGRYPLWRARPGEAFALSPTVEAIAGVYRLLRGREWVGLGVVLSALGLLGHWREAQKQKDRPVLLPLEGPGGLHAALSYRADRGLRLHFHESTPPERFPLWWRWFWGYLERSLPLDAPPPREESPAWDFWLELLERARAHPSKMVGVVELG